MCILCVAQDQNRGQRVTNMIPNDIHIVEMLNGSYEVQRYSEAVAHTLRIFTTYSAALRYARSLISEDEN